MSSEDKPMGDRPSGATSRRSMPRWVRPVALGVAAVMAAGVSAAAVQAMRLIRVIDDSTEKIRVRELDPEEPSHFSSQPRNVLVLGSDSREGLTPEEQAQAGTPEDVDGERSDTIILLHIDPDREQAVVVHFPRDLRVQIPGHGEDKINAAFSIGGPDLTVRTVKQFTGLPIHNYIEVDFAGFQNLVDLLGGVKVCVDRPMFDELAGLNLPRRGCYTMRGPMALAFVRARHVEGDTIPDFSRIRRQQQFMRAFFNKLVSLGTFLDTDLIREASAQVTTDDQLDSVDLVALGEELRKLADEEGAQAETLDFRVVPGVAGESFVEPIEAEVERLFSGLREGTELPANVGTAPEGLEESPAVIKVQVLDGGNPKAVRNVATELRRAGFVVFPPRAAPPAYRTTEILYRAGKESRGGVVEGWLPGLPIGEGPPFLMKGGADVAVVIGEDYRPG